MMKNKNVIIYTLLIYGFIGMIVGSFFDLDINKALYSKGDFFPNFFKIVSEIPMVILISVASLVYKKNNVGINQFIKIILSIIALAFPLVSSFTILNYFEISNIVYSFGIFCIYAITIHTITNNIEYFDNQKLLDFSLYIIVSILTIFVIFNLMKNIWGRQRFSSMYTKNDFSNFANWWQINGLAISDIYKSFPSGHSASAGTTLLLIYAPDIFKIKNQTIRTLLVILPIIFTICTQFARIIDGAHYLTDVSMSLIICITVILTTKHFILNKYFNQ